MVINYDRYETEGLTTDDFIEAISASYGSTTTLAPSAKSASESYGDREDVLAQWQDLEPRILFGQGAGGAVEVLAGDIDGHIPRGIDEPVEQ